MLDQFTNDFLVVSEGSGVSSRDNTRLQGEFHDGTDDENEANDEEGDDYENYYEDNDGESDASNGLFVLPNSMHEYDRAGMSDDYDNTSDDMSDSESSSDDVESNSGIVVVNDSGNNEGAPEQRLLPSVMTIPNSALLPIVAQPPQPSSSSEQTAATVVPADSSTSDSTSGPKSEEDQADACIVCFDVLLVGLSVIPECGHVFHTECIHRWMQIDERNTKAKPTKGCPQCRIKCSMRPVKLRFDARPLAKGQYADSILTQKVAELRTEVETAQRVRTEIETHLAQMQKVNQTLNTKLQAKIIEARGLTQKLDAERSEEQTVRRQLEVLRDQLKASDEARKHAEKSAVDHEKKIDQLEIQIDHINGTNRKLKSRVEETDVLAKSKFQLEEKVDTMKRNITKLEFDLQRLKEVNSLQATSRALGGANDYQHGENSPNPRKRAFENAVQQIRDEDTSYLTRQNPPKRVGSTSNAVKPKLFAGALGAASMVNSLPMLPYNRMGTLEATARPRTQQRTFNTGVLRPATKKQATMDNFMK